VPLLLQQGTEEGRGKGHWREAFAFKTVGPLNMAEFGGNDSASQHMPWRDRLEREASEQDGQQGSSSSQSQHPQAYDRYSPRAVSEAEDWPGSASHNSHDVVGSPTSQTSAGSMIDSPQSESRRSVDMSISASGQSSASHGEHQMSLSERRQEKRKMKRFR
jgi:hypothetical protein